MNGDGQGIMEIGVEQLLPRIEDLKREGYRLVQVDCVRGECYELNYSFDKDLQLLTLRLRLDAGSAKIPSAGGLYLAAALYENELHDLFGIEVEGLPLDYGGTFYRTRVKTPFRSSQEASAQKEGG